MMHGQKNIKPYDLFKKHFPYLALFHKKTQLMFKSVTV